MKYEIQKMEKGKWKYGKVKWKKGNGKGKRKWKKEKENGKWKWLNMKIVKHGK
jgi:hypothetical protein